MTIVKVEAECTIYSSTMPYVTEVKMTGVGVAPAKVNFTVLLCDVH